MGSPPIVYCWSPHLVTVLAVSLMSVLLAATPFALWEWQQWRIGYLGRVPCGTIWRVLLSGFVALVFCTAVETPLCLLAASRRWTFPVHTAFVYAVLILAPVFITWGICILVWRLLRLPFTVPRADLSGGPRLHWSASGGGYH